MKLFNKIKYKNISVDELDLGEDEELKSSKVTNSDSSLDSIDDFKLLKEMDSIVDNINDNNSKQGSYELKSMNEFGTPSHNINQDKSGKRKLFGFINSSSNLMNSNAKTNDFEIDIDNFGHTEKDSNYNDNYVEEVESAPKAGEKMEGTDFVYGYQGGYMTPYVCNGTGVGRDIINLQEVLDIINSGYILNREDWHAIENQADLLVNWDMISGKEYCEIIRVLVDNMPEDMYKVYSFRVDKSYKMGLRTLSEITEFAHKNRYYIEMEDQNGVYHSGIHLALLNALEHGNIDGKTYFEFLTPYPHLI